MFIRCKNKVVESSQLILDGRYEDLLSHYKFNVEEALKKSLMFIFLLVLMELEKQQQLVN